MAPPLILSYAQNGEDTVLGRAFVDPEFGFYVDIGACCPVQDSVTLHFYESGWRGVNVEPDRELHTLFLKARPHATKPPLGGRGGELHFIRRARVAMARSTQPWLQPAAPAGQMCAGDVAE